MKINKIIQGMHSIIILFLNVFFSSAACAVPCTPDIDQMTAQITKYGYIYSIDEKQINLIISTSEDKDHCFAHALYCPGGRRDCQYRCIVKWEKGNWGNTLACLQS